MKYFTPGSHASTFGGNFLSSSAGCVVIEIIKEKNLIENAYKMGNYLKEKLSEINWIKRIKGMGLLIGIETERFNSFELCDILIEKKILTVPAGEKVLRFLPPLIVTKNEIDHLINTLKSI